MNQWTTFFVNGDMFAVRVDEVQEVLADQPLTPVPLAPAYVSGLLNLRGQIMPTIDLRKRLDMPERALTAEKSLLVLRHNGRSLCAVVDTFGDILQLDADRWMPLPDTVDAKHRSYVFGIAPMSNRVVLGLRVTALDTDPDEISE